MKQKLTGIILFLIISLLSRGADGEYAVSKIPAALLKNANAVVRTDMQVFEVYSFTKARLRTKIAVTILNENADRYATLVVSYDKLRSVGSIDGKLFDFAGKELKSLKNKDIRDYSAVSDMSLMEDNRVKVHEFHYKEYPYTVEYEYESEYNNTFLFPDWFPQYSYNKAIERASLLVKCPNWFKFNYKAFNYPKGKPAVTEEKDYTIHEWSVENLPALEREFAAPERMRIGTSVLFSPEQFEIDGYKGSFASWNEFGKFIARLNEGRDKLPDNIKQQVHTLTDGIKDPVEKTRVLYEYLQKNTRYISIQLGIGGWQTFDANYVATKSYGDCKALSNYMYSLLKEAGVKSCYTLIHAGEEENYFIPEFPNNYFNHIVLCVPQPKDTIWLECTSQQLPAGYLSAFTSDRYALAITEDGGKLVHTPKYGLKENLEIRNISAKLDEEAALQINVSTRYTGIQQDFYQRKLAHMSKDKIKEELEKRFDFATYEVNNFDYKETKASLPAVLESLSLVVRNYATITGKRLFIVPNVMTRHLRKLSADSTRKYDIEIGTEYHDIDTVAIALPPGYTAESLPKDIAISNKFGRYSCSVKLSGSTLTYYRSMEQYSGLFPAKDYPELVSFFEAVYKADRSKVVLVKNETAPRGF